MGNMRKHAKTNKNMGQHGTHWTTALGSSKFFKLFWWSMNKGNKGNTSLHSLLWIQGIHFFRTVSRSSGRFQVDPMICPRPWPDVFLFCFQSRPPKLFKHPNPLWSKSSIIMPLYQLYPIIPCAFLSCSGPCFLPQTIQSRRCGKPSA